MSLQNEMERIGRLLAYDRNLRVDVRGTRAYSTPGRVVIPNVDAYKHLGNQAERMLHGLLDHECGHAKYSDHSVMEQAAKEGGEALQMLFNALEDARIERLMGVEYIGCRQNLRRKNRWFWDDPKWQEQLRDGDPWMAFCGAVTMAYRNGDIERREVEAAQPQAWAMILECEKHGLQHFHTLASSQEVFTLAKKLWQLFLTPPPPPPEPDDDDEKSDGAGSDCDDESDEDEEQDGEGNDNQGSGETGDDEDDTDGEEGGDAGPHDNKGDQEDEEGPEGEEGEDDEAEESDEDGEEEDDEGGAETDDEENENEDEGDSDSDEEESESSDSDASDSESDAGDDGSEEEAAASDSDPGSAIVDPYAPFRAEELKDWKRDPIGTVTPEEAIAQVLERAEKTGDDYRIFSYEFDLERDFVLEPIDDRRHDAYFERDPISEIAEDGELASAALAQAFEVALKARRQKRPVGGHDEGEIDLDVLTEFAVGSATADSIYQQYVAEDDRTVTVAVVLDCSGSMRSGSDLVAKRAAYAIHHALATCQIDHEITGFTTVSSSDTPPWVRGWSRESGLKAHFDRMRAAMIEAADHGVSPALFGRELYRWNFTRYPRASSPEEEMKNAVQALKNGHPLLVPIHAVFKPYGVSEIRGLQYAVGQHENLDGEAVMWQARRLALRPESRRVMFVLSDGMPSGARSEELSAVYLQKAVRDVIAAGIEIYGIGVADDAVKHFYPRYWVAKDVDELMQVAFTSVAEVLMEGRQEAEWVGPL